jgi:hypothetical protein
MPPLEEVPSGTYFCLDCSPKGTTVCLEEYFDNHHDERANYESSLHFVQQRLQDIQDESGDIPQSEISRATKLHRDAISFKSRFVQTKSPSGQSAANKSTSKSNKRIDPIKPDFFMGKCVRIYCPTDNQYHSGRIIDWRKATHSDQFWESEVADIEYLVRFPAGKDFRKTPYQQWIVLEEHALAVGATLIWGMNVQRKGVMGFNPGQVWLRTSLELLPIQSYLAKNLWQMYSMGDVVKLEHKSWALASFYGEDSHELLELKDESVDYFSVAFGEARHQRHLISNDLDPRVEIFMGLVQVEWEEQERVRAWKNMKLDNSCHPKALTLRDEASLKPPCLQRERDSRLCPSIQIDFDRTYLLGCMTQEPTRDMAASLVCELVAPSPQIMQQFQEQV